MQKKTSLVLIVIIFASMLLFAEGQGYLDGAKTKTRETTAPVSLFFAQLSGRTSGFFSGIFRIGKLQKENAELREKLNKLQAENAQLSEDKKENERLKSLLGFTSANKYSYIPAEVQTFDPSNIRSSLTINKGSKNGLKKGMAVISDGFLVGRILEVSDETAKVQLVTDPESAIPATLQNINTNGIIKGQIGFGLSLEKVPQGDEIKPGDTVITSGLGGDIPKGLIVGKIEKIESKENSLFTTATVRVSANITSLSRLIVIKG